MSAGFKNDLASLASVTTDVTRSFVSEYFLRAPLDNHGHWVEP